MKKIELTADYLLCHILNACSNDYGTEVVIWTDNVENIGWIELALKTIGVTEWYYYEENCPGGYFHHYEVDVEQFKEDCPEFYKKMKDNMNQVLLRIKSKQS